MAKKRDIRIKVTGQPRKDIDTRRMARAIIRLAIESDTEAAQALADALETKEAERQAGLRRARAEQRANSDRGIGRGAA